MDAKAQQQSGWLNGRRIALALAVLTLGAAIGLTLGGRHDKSSSPATAAPSSTDPITVLQQQAQAEPTSAARWTALGSAYFEAGRYPDAASAFEKATRAAPDQAGGWSALGEARVMASRREPLPAEAVGAFERALALDSKDPRARYFMAVRKDLAGDHDGAIGDWMALLADTPAGAPWEADLRRTIEQVGKINGIPVAPRLAAVKQPDPPAPASAGVPRGPSAEDLRAAAAIPPSEQREMAQGMVARLEQRLAADEKNLDGWVMLMRSRVTLGEPAKAAKALNDAVAANPAQAAELRRQAEALGIR